jgi:hypothetical protein
MPPLVALTDRELAAVMAAASSLPVERRSEFLERVAARLRGGTNADFDAAVRKGLAAIRAPALAAASQAR